MCFMIEAHLLYSGIYILAVVIMPSILHRDTTDLLVESFPTVDSPRSIAAGADITQSSSFKATFSSTNIVLLPSSSMPFQSPMALDVCTGSLCGLLPISSIYAYGSTSGTSSTTIAASQTTTVLSPTGADYFQTSPISTTSIQKPINIVNKPTPSAESTSLPTKSAHGQKVALITCTVIFSIAVFCLLLLSGCLCLGRQRKARSIQEDGLGEGNAQAASPHQSQNNFTEQGRGGCEAKGSESTILSPTSSQPASPTPAMRKPTASGAGSATVDFASTLSLRAHEERLTIARSTATGSVDMDFSRFGKQAQSRSTSDLHTPGELSSQSSNTALSTEAASFDFGFTKAELQGGTLGDVERRIDVVDMPVTEALLRGNMEIEGEDTKIENSKRKARGLSPFFGSISASSSNEALHPAYAWKKFEGDLEMETDQADVKTEETEVLDLPSFPAPATSNLKQLSRARSSSESLILVKAMEIHMEEMGSDVTRTYRTNLSFREDISETNSEAPSGASGALSNSVANKDHISKADETALSSPSYFTTPPGSSEPIPTASWTSSRNSIMLKKPAKTEVGHSKTHEPSTFGASSRVGLSMSFWKEMEATK